jgi:hypothetical protein
VSPLDAGNYLASGDLNTSNPIVSQYFLEDDAQAYLIVEVLQSDSVSVSAKTDRGTTVNVDIPEIQKVLGAKIGVTLGGADSSTMTFKGPEPITFGFKAFAIAFVNGRWTLKGTQSSGDMAFAVEDDDESTGEPVLFVSSGTVRL